MSSVAASITNERYVGYIIITYQEISCLLGRYSGLSKEGYFRKETDPWRVPVIKILNVTLVVVK